MVRIFKEKIAASTNKKFLLNLYFLIGYFPPSSSPLHLASLSYSQCCLCDVGQAMSGLILLMYQVSSHV